MPKKIRPVRLLSGAILLLPCYATIRSGFEILPERSSVRAAYLILGLL
jgi:hypothetical protein